MKRAISILESIDFIIDQAFFCDQKLHFVDNRLFNLSVVILFLVTEILPSSLSLRSPLVPAWEPTTDDADCICRLCAYLPYERQREICCLIHDEMLQIVSHSIDYDRQLYTMDYYRAFQFT